MTTTGASAAVETYAEVEKLAAAAAAGDSDAMGQLYEQYVDAIYRYVHAKTRDHATTEDVCSDVWLRVVRAIPAYTPTGKGFPSWLFTIARNTTMDSFRSHVRRPSTPSGDMLHLDSPAIEVGPEEAALRHEAANQIAAALRDMPARQAQTITLRFFDGLSVAEVASVTGTSVAAVKSAQHRGLKVLATILPEEMRTLGASLSVSHVQVDCAGAQTTPSATR